MISKKEIGKTGEKQASIYLKNNGYIIIENNWRCRYGEIDIIAEKDGVICFVEVKSRRNDYFGYPEESIDEKKIKKIILSACYYISMNHIYDRCIRIDAISVFNSGKKIFIKHIKNIS